MADKIKRLEKVLKKTGLKGLLKPVDNLENSHFVIVENPKYLINSPAFKRKILTEL